MQLIALSSSIGRTARGLGRCIYMVMDGGHGVRRNTMALGKEKRKGREGGREAAAATWKEKKRGGKGSLGECFY